MNYTNRQSNQLIVKHHLTNNQLMCFKYLNEAVSSNEFVVTLPFSVLAQSSNYQEVWQDNSNTVAIDRENSRWVSQSDSFLVLVYPGESTQLAEQVSHVYDDAFQTGKARGYEHLVRVWNFFPAINDDVGGMENYQRFCVARHALLDKQNQLGRANPAATAIGTHNHQSCYVFIFAKTPGQVVENTRQVSAWEYPLHYSPKQPRFSRALLLGDLLMCSGTASVVGHETRHKDDLIQQFKECMINVDVLLKEANIHTNLRDGLFRFYLRDANDVDVIKRCIKESGLNHYVVLGGDICREDLLVECEAVFQNI